MKTSTSDCCLRVCALLAAFCLGYGHLRAVADCDNKCRERYTFEQDTQSGVKCINYVYKDCASCIGGLCIVNETDPLGTCQENTMLTQQAKFASCTLICTLNPGGIAEALYLGSEEKYGDLKRGPLVCKQEDPPAG